MMPADVTPNGTTVAHYPNPGTEPQAMAGIFPVVGLAEWCERFGFPLEPWQRSWIQAMSQRGCTYYQGCDRPAKTCGYCETHCLCTGVTGRRADAGFGQHASSHFVVDRDGRVWAAGGWMEPPPSNRHPYGLG